MKYKIALLLALIVAQPLLAKVQNTYYKVQRLYVWTDGVGQIWVEEGGEHTCSDQKYPRRYLLHNDAIRYEQKFSLLLSARVTGEGVKMTYTCDSSGLPYIDAIRL